jgi:hypothetical protein
MVNILAFLEAACKADSVNRTQMEADFTLRWVDFTLK